MSRSFRVVLVTILLLTSLAVLATPVAAEPDAPLLEPSAEAIIDGQYIVVFNDDVSDVPELTNQLIDRHGGEVLHIYEHALRGFSARLSDATVDALRSEPTVSFVQKDIEISIRQTTQTSAPWGLDRIDQRDLPLNTTYTYGNTGAGVNIYILDDGVRVTHEEFGGRASVAVSACGSTDTGANHGTHVAGIAAGSTYGVAKGANIISVSMYACKGNAGSTFVAAIDWITENHVKPAVVNMSFGWELTLGQPKTAEEIAVENSIDAGIVYVGATANEFVDSCADFPSRIDGVITVANMTITDEVNANTAYGPCVDIFAPGSSITSAIATSDTAVNVASGTSMATPHVSGVAALYLERHPNATPAEVFDAIVGNATVDTLTSPSGATVLPNDTPNRMLNSLVGLLSIDPSAGGPYSLAEGASISLDGSTADTGGTVTFAWDINGDGIYTDASGENPTLSWSQLTALGIANGPATFDVSVQVLDGTDTFTSPETTLTLANTAPVVTAPVNQTAVIGTPASITLGSFADPGIEGSWQVSVNWGDGSPVEAFSTGNFGSLGSLDHAFAMSGAITVTIQVNDATDTGTATFVVNVLSASDLLAQLRTTTITMVSDATTERTLLTSLDLTLRLINAGQPRLARVALVTYETQVMRANSTRRITPALAQRLIADARAVANALR